MDNKKKEYLSPSQAMLWLKSKREYKKKYFEGVETYKTIQMMNGTNVHKMMDGIYPGSVMEVELETNISGVLCKGYMDMLWDGGIYEFKTGKSWTKEEVDNHLQLHMYVLMFREIYKVEPTKVQLIHIDKDMNTTFIDYTIDDQKLEEAKALIVKIRKEIDDAWDNWEVKIDDKLLKECDVISKRMYKLNAKKQDIETQISILRSKLEMIGVADINNEYITMYETIRKENVYNEEDTKLIAEVKDMQKIYMNDFISSKKPIKVQESRIYNIKFKNKNA